VPSVFFRSHLDYRAEKRLVVVCAAFGLLVMLVTGRIKLRLLVVSVAPNKEVDADGTETPEHAFRVFAVLSQTVAQTFVNTASWQHRGSELQSPFPRCFRSP
jgi:hypothetical protein